MASLAMTTRPTGAPMSMAATRGVHCSNRNVGATATAKSSTRTKTVASPVSGM